MTIAAAEKSSTILMAKYSITGMVVVAKDTVLGKTATVVATIADAGMIGTSAADSKHVKSALPG